MPTTAYLLKTISEPSASGGSQRLLRQVTARHTAAAPAAPHVVHVLPTLVARFMTPAHICTRCVIVQLKNGWSIAGPLCTTSRPSNAVTKQTTRSEERRVG